jgi:hypothetical protein
MKTIFKFSLAIVVAMMFGLTACSGKNSLTPKQDSAAIESKAANHFFVRFTPPNTFKSTLINGGVEMSLNGGYNKYDPHTNHSWWTDYYAYFQTVRNTHTFEMKDFWLVPYLPSPTWGMFRISQNGSTFTLSRIEGKSYVTVITSNSYAAIVDRLQFIYVNGTPQHKAAINKLDILSYRIN